MIGVLVGKGGVIGWADGKVGKWEFWGTLVALGAWEEVNEAGAGGRESFLGDQTITATPLVPRYGSADVCGEGTAGQAAVRQIGKGKGELETRVHHEVCWCEGCRIWRT